MSTVIEVVGLLAALIGASAMDSPSLLLPVIITVTGGVVMFIGLKLEERGF